MKNTSKALSFALIVGTYIIIRLPLLTVQNAYLDYDEGTYLMFARLIMHGVLPYRDIFAVHPPLYYYTLAAWMWAFGDNYVVGRSLSTFFGFLSVIIAYLTGKELRNEKLGLAFALVITLDPMAVKLNTLVLHGSMIEFFTLLSLWVLVKYLRVGNVKFAYLALALASIGSTAKFTIIPYLVALYLFILFNQSQSLKEYLFGVTDRILTSNQARVILVTYLLWTGIVVAIGVLVPITFVRIIAIVPGFHGIDKMGQVYTAAAFLFFWLGITIYLFRINYVEKIPHFIKELIKSARIAISLASVILVSKVLIEVPLGIMVSRNYIQQTYIDQSGRGFPFMGIFWFFHSVLATLQSDRLDNASYILPAFLLVAFLLILKESGKQLKLPQELKALLLLNIVFYLVVIPIIPDIRMMYSMFLLLYLVLLYPIISMRRKSIGAIVIITVLLLAVNVGIDLNYPKGKLAISATPNIKAFREDLGEYIRSQNLQGTYLSINPMDAYYLNLTVIPYMIDTFGLGYLQGENLVTLINSYHPHYAVLDTWMFNIMKRAKVLFNVYNPVLQYALTNGTLLFAESNPRGECVEIFNINANHVVSKWNINSPHGQIELYYNNTKIFSISPKLQGQYTLKIENQWDTTYTLTILAGKKVFTGSLQFNTTTLVLDIPNVSWELHFDGLPMYNTKPIFNGNLSTIQICTPRACFRGIGEFRVENGKVIVSGPFRLTAEKS